MTAPLAGPGGDPQGAGRGIIYAPWERAFERIVTPFEEFVHRQTTSGLLLLVAAAAALLLANGPLAGAYHRLLELPLAVGLGEWTLEKTLHHWVNDGLMAFFFFLVGMELKRELLVGELADPRQAALPIVAAIGGMAAPALIYFMLNPEGLAARGWGIPMATDIAFAVGVLSLLAARVPQALITFLVALAIVDDLGAVLVIALFYSERIAIDWLGGAAAVVVLLMAFNLAGVRRPLPYFLLAVVLWLALLNSGVHATLAGVIGGFTVPARPRYDPAAFSASVRRLMARFDANLRPGASIMVDDQMRAVVQALGAGVVGVQAPLQRLEHALHLPVAFLVVPVFALFNAGIPIDFASSGAAAMADPVALGVAAGLLAGKAIGITGASWVALRLGLAALPAGTRFAQIAGVSLLGGIGFTMSIFIAELAFAGEPQLLVRAKTGILLASIAGGLAGLACLWWLGDPARARRGDA